MQKRASVDSQLGCTSLVWQCLRVWQILHMPARVFLLQSRYPCHGSAVESALQAALSANESAGTKAMFQDVPQQFRPCSRVDSFCCFDGDVCGIGCFSGRPAGSRHAHIRWRCTRLAPWCDESAVQCFLPGVAATHSLVDAGQLH